MPSVKHIAVYAVIALVAYAIAARTPLAPYISGQKA